jgi:hypothetical protein
MNIGANAHSIKVKNCGYTIHGVERSLDKTHENATFLKRLVELDIPCDSLFGISTIYICDENGLIHELDDIAGKIIKYGDKFYEVPSKDKIIEMGFDHLLRNAEDHRIKVEEENERKKQLTRMQAAMSGLSNGLIGIDKFSSTLDSEMRRAEAKAEAEAEAMKRKAAMDIETEGLSKRKMKLW